MKHNRLKIKHILQFIYAEEGSDMFPLHHKVSYGHPGTWQNYPGFSYRGLSHAKCFLVLKTDVFFIKVVVQTV